MTNSETKNDWIFTFGHGHVDAKGKSLLGYYVVINGTFHDAREQMVEHFGVKWSFQYKTKHQAGVQEWKLVELKL